MTRLQKCPCGSGLRPESQLDYYGIFLCYTCPKCHDAMLARYRPDILEPYECDEPIEPEEPEDLA